ncbi:sensor histidine kinase [Streptomyces mobaraensis]|uniref:sensor histidine kinase n=1 Tax=Streptomyces mobaraensis TaxID=35621 RepID=UPI001F21BC0D|nr:sensor domain-containing protein [Streptomyces mobaraensis]
MISQTALLGRPLPFDGIRNGTATVVAALGRLAGGLGTALGALAALSWAVLVVLLCPVGVGVVLLPTVPRALRAAAGRERRRQARRGRMIVAPYATPAPGLGPVARFRAVLADPATGRDARWALRHGVSGLPAGLLGLLLPVLVVRETAYPLYWWLLPRSMATSGLGFRAEGWPVAVAVGVEGLGWCVVTALLLPRLARSQERAAARLLGPHPSVDLTRRIAEVTASRAAALRAHAAELRRIERALHDTVQNRLVGAALLIGTARRAGVRDAGRADGQLERAQTAVEEALAELRAVGRGVFPSVLEERGLDGAVAGLAAECAVPCRVDVGPLGQPSASAAATAYHVVAEALANVVRHSGAARAEVTIRRAGDVLRVRVHDDGRGGARERAPEGAGRAGGTGLAGMRHRVEALDGSLAFTSPVGGPTVVEVELPCAW